jgi:tRNA threonylcarbamoyladenosine biosynthesis protein TsaE
MTRSTFLPDEAATVTFGRALARATEGQALITLSGDLGTGKTTLSRGIVQSLGHEGAVKSPTYTLVEPYEIGAVRIFHFDLYRLEDPEELEFIGLWDYLADSALVLIEWPEKAFGVLPPADLALILSLEERGRRITWEAHTPRGEAMAAALATA